VTSDGAVRLVADVCGNASDREIALRLGLMIASKNIDARL
jgi:hypothetical protein